MAGKKTAKGETNKSWRNEPYSRLIRVGEKRLVFFLGRLDEMKRRKRRKFNWKQRLGLSLPLYLSHATVESDQGGVGNWVYNDGKLY